ncbi:PucR C-terminal helix-turn-helix domain-containing protein [Prauserella alba]|uniref:PucR family transcriptional regulator n=1 Tax=Prauserella alba TaxID=176898 RepID=A0ABN1VE03_9PSEU|nr:PucR C-terminal helix-turn-helix domain-containing protein [Prauserella alba]
MRGIGGIMRPELEDVAGEIIAEIRAAIPEYQGSFDGPYGRWMTEGVRQAIALFVDRLGEPAAATGGPAHPRGSAPLDGHEVHRRIGRQELHEGRSLDTLQHAYRIGVRVAWRRIMRLGRRSGFSSAVMSQLADRMLALMDELSSVALDGYREAKSEPADPVMAARRRLVRLLACGRPVARDDIEDLARLARWPVPDTVTAIAFSPPVWPSSGEVPCDMLADVTGTSPFLLAPGAVTADEAARLQASLVCGPVGVGVPVEPFDAADSLRLARRVLTLAADGAASPDAVVWAEERLPELLLQNADAVIAQLRRRLFEPLSELTQRQRERTIETLRAWLEQQGNAHAMADRLGLHPQTVRYRMRRIEDAFGARLRDARGRFELELAVYSLSGGDPAGGDSSGGDAGS